MRRQNYVGSGALAGSGADDITGFVDVDVFQSETLEEPLKFEAALFFVEGDPTSLTPGRFARPLVREFVRSD